MNSGIINIPFLPKFLPLSIVSGMGELGWNHDKEIPKWKQWWQPHTVKKNEPSFHLISKYMCGWVLRTSRIEHHSLLVLLFLLLSFPSRMQCCPFCFMLNSMYVRIFMLYCVRWRCLYCLYLVFYFFIFCFFVAFLSPFRVVFRERHAHFKEK